MHEADSFHSDVTVTNNAEPPVYAAVPREGDTTDGIANGSMPNDYAYAVYTPSSQEQAVNPLSALHRGGGGEAMAGNQEEMTTTTDPVGSDEYASYSPRVTRAVVEQN